MAELLMESRVVEVDWEFVDEINRSVRRWQGGYGGTDLYEPMKTLCPVCGLILPLFPELEEADLPKIVKSQLQYYIWTLNSREGLPLLLPRNLQEYEELMVRCYRPAACSLVEGWDPSGYLLRSCPDDWCRCR